MSPSTRTRNDTQNKHGNIRWNKRLGKTWRQDEQMPETKEECSTKDSGCAPNLTQCHERLFMRTLALPPTRVRSFSQGCEQVLYVISRRNGSLPCPLDKQRLPSPRIFFKKFDCEVLFQVMALSTTYISCQQQAIIPNVLMSHLTKEATHP